MDTVRKCAIAVVMIVPGFVLGGLVWSWLHSWFAVLGLEILVVLTYLMIVSGKFSKTAEGIH